MLLTFDCRLRHFFFVWISDRFASARLKMSTAICYGGGNRKKMVLNTVFRRRNNATVGLGSVLFEFCLIRLRGLPLDFKTEL